MRVLIDLLEDAKCDPELSSQLEREVVEIDQLTEDLLASSRLEFQAVNKTGLDGVELIRRALERCNLSSVLSRVTTDDAKLEGDATLLGRALANLIENAARHGGGAEAVELSGDEHTLTFAVRDRGSGFSDDALSRAFDRFYRGQTPREKSSSSLGLGLALVRRIARAHGGEAFAENVPEGGARVGFSVARKSQ
jgi:signal transduction histidine kinase